MSEIIIPEGRDLTDYLNKGYAICNKCGAVMDRKEHPEGACDILVCPSCGWECSVMEYEYEEDDELAAIPDLEDDIPIGCQACDGPYPDCKWSCKMFDI